MMNRRLTFSVVIPVYNEESTIGACLEALKRQTLAAQEIIIVDNNSTDKTIAAAKGYAGVRILREPRQGQRYAQITGFNAARGDIIVRIDADTVVPPTYLQQLDTIFTDHNIDAVTGYGHSRYEPFPLASKLYSRVYFAFVRAVFGYEMLWGANMAFRAKHWPKIKNLLITDKFTIEDEDVALALASIGARAVVWPSLTVSVEMKSVLQFSKYNLYVKSMFGLYFADKRHPRSQLATRLAPIPFYKRIVPFVGGFLVMIATYVLTIVYSCGVAIGRFFTARSI